MMRDIDYTSYRERILERMKRGIRRGLVRGGIVLQEAVRTELGRAASIWGRSGTSPGSPPGVLTGTLRRSIQLDQGKLGESVPSVRVGTSVPYAKIQEFGGTILAKDKRLTIPLSARAARLRATYPDLRSIEGLTVIKIHGHTFLVRDPRKRTKGFKERRAAPKKGEGLELLFLLADKLTLPARPYFRPGVVVSKDQVINAIVEEARRGIRGGTA